MTHKRIDKTCDVAVVGGGPGGLTVAVVAARRGCRVILAEKTAALGGAAASGLGILGYLDRGGHKSLGGFSQEIFDRLQNNDGAIGHFRCPVHNSISPVSPDRMKILAVEMCREAGVEVLFGCDITDVEAENGHIKGITVYGKCTDIHISAKIFVDGTGDGDLAYLAGCEFIAGQDGTGVNQPGTLMFTVTDYDMEKFYRFIEENPGEAGIKEDYADGYNLDFFRATRGHCFIGLTETIKKARAAGDFDVPRNQFIYIKTPNENLLAINTVRITDLDASDVEQYSRGVAEGYRQIGVLMNFMRKYMPGFGNAAISSVSPTLGIRESRHFKGIKRLTAQSMFNYLTPDDTVALCAYNVDIHSGTATHIDLTPLQRPFGIPYGCLVAKDADNLFLGGRTLSVDSTVFASARVMGPLIACAESIGIASEMCVKENTLPAQVDVKRVRKAIIDAGGILEAGK